jgi:hypothetical protein|nr:MAG TPA_asm: hypothetical protein [Caudoviricetes sp.]
MANYPYLPIEEFKPKLLNSIFQYASELFDKNPNPNDDELKSINEEVNKRADNFCKINGYRKTFTVNIDTEGGGHPRFWSTIHYNPFGNELYPGGFGT